MGRKNRYYSYVEPHLDKIQEWVEYLSEENIADKLGVSYSSLQKYKREYPALNEALQRGRQNLVDELRKTMKKRATGFYYEETKIREITTGKPGMEITTRVKDVHRKYCPPDVGAAHLLLKNLDPEWRNDDLTTVELKKQKLEMEKERNEGW